MPTLQLAFFSKKRTPYATIFLGLQGGFKVHKSSGLLDALGVISGFQLMADILTFSSPYNILDKVFGHNPDICYE